jgi:ABC-type branched-subunit amino acid transport system substrate-binding protein
MKRFSAATCAAALALAMAACGSSSDTPSGSSGSTAKTGTPAGEAIKLGLIGDLTRPDNLNAPFIAGGAQARADAINASGGIKGRQVRLISCDDKGDPNTATACARKMVSEKVVAMVGVTSINEAQVFPVLEQAAIPVVAPIPVSGVALTSKISYAFTPGLIGAFLAVPQMLVKQTGARHPSMMYPSNIPGTSDALVKFFKTGAENVGASAGPIAGYDLGATQFNAQAVKATGPPADAVLAFGSGGSQGPVFTAVFQQGKKMPVSTLASNLDKKTIDFLGDKVNGILLVGITKAVDSTAPGVLMFNKDVAKFAPDMARNEISLNSWAGVWAVERMVEKMTGTIDAAAVTRAVSHLADFDMGGIYPPITTTKKATDFPGMDRVFNAKVDFQKYENGKIVSLLGNDFYDPFPAAN